MPVIRITDDTWDRLKRWAIPLEDSTEDAIKKVLDFAEEQQRSIGKTRNEKPNLIREKPHGINPKKLHRGEKTPQYEFRRPILEALYELGGKAHANDVLDIVGEKMKNILKTVDYQMLPSGTDIRWRNTAAWERNNMVHREGLLKANSPAGVWEISDKGIKMLKENTF